MPHVTKIVQLRVLSEILNRGWSFIIPQVPLLLIFLLFSPWMFTTNSLFQIGATLIIVGSIVFSIPIFFKSKETNVTKTFHMLTFASLLVGCGWGTILSAFYLTDGMVSSTTLISIVITCGLAAGVFVLFNMKTTLMWSYLFPAFLIPSVVSLSLIENLQQLSLFLLVLIYNIFLLSTAPLIKSRFLRSLRNEIRLSEEKDKLTSLMNAFPGLVTVINEEQKYEMINTFGLYLFRGINIIGKDVGFLDQDGEFAQVIQTFIESEQQSLTREMKVKTGQGDHWSLMSMAKMSYPHGWIVVSSIIIDEMIEARKIAENEKSKAEHTARLASLGEMAQGVAHEINNPLSVIMFSAEELTQKIKENYFDKELYENFTSKILRMSQRVEKIVKALRYFSRDAENDPVKSVPISMIIDHVMDFQSGKYKNDGIEFVIHPFVPTLVVKCREVQIMQALINVLNNAHFAVTNSAVPIDKKIEITIKDSNDFVSIDVTDSGLGMSEEASKRIFEPFFTTKEVNQGTGLGLSIAMGLIEKNGGQLQLTNLKPTTFSLIIPKSKN
jgi:signal transduction histidine kinase